MTTAKQIVQLIIKGVISYLAIWGLKQPDAFNRTWWLVLSIDELVTWQHLSIEGTGHHVVLKASSCLKSISTRLIPHSHQKLSCVKTGVSS